MLNTGQGVPKVILNNFTSSSLLLMKSPYIRCLESYNKAPRSIVGALHHYRGKPLTKYMSLLF
jgi:hypothetical protein